MKALPKFLFADDGGDRMFVIHCHSPRFVMEFDETGKGEPQFIDEPSFNPANGDPALQMARLMREAGDWFMEELQA